MNPALCGRIFLCLRPSSGYNFLMKAKRFIGCLFDRDRNIHLGRYAHIERLYILVHLELAPGLNLFSQYSSWNNQAYKGVTTSIDPAETAFGPPERNCFVVMKDGVIVRAQGELHYNGALKGRILVEGQTFDIQLEEALIETFDSEQARTKEQCRRELEALTTGTPFTVSREGYVALEKLPGPRGPLFAGSLGNGLVRSGITKYPTLLLILILLIAPVVFFSGVEKSAFLARARFATGIVSAIEATNGKCRHNKWDRECTKYKAVVEFKDETGGTRTGRFDFGYELDHNKSTAFAAGAVGDPFDLYYDPEKTTDVRQAGFVTYWSTEMALGALLLVLIAFFVRSRKAYLKTRRSRG
jgi:hypothetical protein